MNGKKIAKLLLIGTCVLLIGMGAIYHYLKYTTRMSNPHFHEEWVCYQIKHNPTIIEEAGSVTMERRSNELYVEVPYLNQVIQFEFPSFEYEDARILYRWGKNYDCAIVEVQTSEMRIPQLYLVMNDLMNKWVNTNEKRLELGKKISPTISIVFDDEYLEKHPIQE